MGRTNKDRCRHCGDTSKMDDNWSPMGICEACDKQAVRNARRQRAKERQMDREIVVRVEPRYRDDIRFIQTTFGEVAVNLDGEPL